MPNNQKRYRNLLIETHHDSPGQDKVIFVPPRTIVSVEVKVDLSKVVCLEKVVQHADNIVSPLVCVHSLINEIVDLY